MNAPLSSDDREYSALFMRALGGDSAAYHQFLSGITTILRRYLAKRITLPNDREDIIQEILLSIHKARHTYDAQRPLFPWLFAIVRFRVADFLRKQYGSAQHVDIAEFENSIAADVTNDSILPESVSEVISRLPEKQRRIIHLLNVEGYTAKEVGERMGMKESAVKVAAHRIYKSIRQKVS